MEIRPPQKPNYLPTFTPYDSSNSDKCIQSNTFGQHASRDAGTNFQTGRITGNSEMAKTDLRFKELDALRGISALAIVLFHLSLRSPDSEFGFRVGVTGVDLFFMISGFVIFLSLNRISSVTEFVVNRCSRLFPTYWTCLSLTFGLQSVLFALQGHFKSGSLLVYLGNLTMFQYYLKLPNVDGPYWTLIIELLFYISIASLFLFQKIKRIVPVFFFLIFFSVCVFTASVKWNLNLLPVFKLFPLLPHLPLFLAGILFYKLKSDALTVKETRIYWLGIILCFVAKLLLATVGGTALGYISFNAYASALAVYFLIFTLFIRKHLTFLISRPTLFLGKISFAMYLIHQWMSSSLLMPWLKQHTPLNYWAAAALTLTTVLIVATLITYLIEIPAGRKMNKSLRQMLRLPLRTNSGIGVRPERAGPDEQLDHS